jgi:hypothetical protein
MWDIGYRIKVYPDIRYNIGLRSLQSDIGGYEIRLSSISLITDIGRSAHLCLQQTIYRKHASYTNSYAMSNWWRNIQSYHNNRERQWSKDDSSMVAHLTTIKQFRVLFQNLLRQFLTGTGWVTAWDGRMLWKGSERARYHATVLWIQTILIRS